MAKSTALICLQFLYLLCHAKAATFEFSNNCGYTVWPGILSSAGISPLSTTGFKLQTGQSRTVNTPANWSGRMWGRTDCTTDSTTSVFTCLTGDCGTGEIECSGSGANPPATLAEFTLAGSGGMDFYDVSLVDGYNLPMLVQPKSSSSSNCKSTGCLVDLNGMCPDELKVVGSSGQGAACKSACEAFGSSEYCCSGEHANPSTCKPSSYSQFFKNACPRAYSYAYDDGTSTFTCVSANYVVTFCPTTTTTTSNVNSDGENPKAVLPLLNNTDMVYLGAEKMSNGGSSSPVIQILFHHFPLLLLVSVSAFLCLSV
ncbi:Thaumatin-like protein 1, putative, expressed [Zostera marina]|uniref:Thaumatin-like protein 1, putative, expressed n=1 Tax=Zostera marina TaxID=29655 RepID=A0A0K9P7J1_ZOSMR|nr:Thaumatin-like protein 1, putative, expressed [Zostera marina]